jgi:hypothetical protein
MKKLPKNMISGNKKTRQRQENHVFLQKISKTMDKMMSWGRNVCPILDDANDPPGHKNMGQQNTLF